MDFDAIVIGTGMGGGALGYQLTRAGLRVLFLERGHPRSDLDLQYSNDYPERFFKGKNRTQVLERSGRATFRVNSWTPVLGGGAGGGTTVYGAVLLPFHPEDLKTWPGFTYPELKPYYQKCDELFNPSGGQDPLLPDRNLNAEHKLSAPAQEVFDFLKKNKLHPFVAPVGFENAPDCKQCFGFFCPRNCKKTSWNVFIEPALKSGRASIEYHTKVTELIVKDTEITGVLCQTPGGIQKFSASHYFLAAGALMTPTLLLNSKSSSFPTGIGNQRDLVGRYLMRHLTDFYFVKTTSPPLKNQHLVEVVASDFCQGNFRWGTLNSVANLMAPELMATEVAQRWKAQSPFPLPARILEVFLNQILRYFTKDRFLISSIMDDSPDFENRVLPESNSEDVMIQYRITTKDRLRLRQNRKYFKNLLSPLSAHLLKVAEDSSFLAHVCGTCRMSHDPSTGVVDSNGKVFGVKNLYISDTSIFPTSGSANPSLTTAACSLKIADHFVRDQWKI